MRSKGDRIPGLYWPRPRSLRELRGRLVRRYASRHPEQGDPQIAHALGLTVQAVRADLQGEWAPEIEAVDA